MCRCGYTGSKPVVECCISAWHIIPPNKPPTPSPYPPLASLGSHYSQPGSTVLHRGCPWRAYPNCDSLLGAQVHSSPWNHSRGGGSRVVINMLQAQLMSHSKSLVLADILCCLVRTFVGRRRKSSLSSLFNSLLFFMYLMWILSAPNQSLHTLYVIQYITSSDEKTFQLNIVNVTKGSKNLSFSFHAIHLV